LWWDYRNADAGKDAERELLLDMSADRTNTTLQFD
jgi:hypothetical protein